MSQRAAGLCTRCTRANPFPGKVRCCPCKFFTNSLIQTERSKVRVWLILSSDLIIIHVQPSFIRFLRPGNQRRHYYIPIRTTPLMLWLYPFFYNHKEIFSLPPFSILLTYLSFILNLSAKYLVFFDKIMYIPFLGCFNRFNDKL